MILIGKGETAEVYRIGNRALKLFYINTPLEMIKREYDSVKMIGDHLELAPKVYDFYHHERQGYYMDYIGGKPLLDLMTNENYKVIIMEFANCHRILHQRVCNFELFSLMDQLAKFIKTLKVYSQEMIVWLLSILSELPDGHSILHGDFMPYNVHDHFQILDWSDVMIGPADGDVARTIYFLLDPSSHPFPINSIVKDYLEGYYKDKIPYKILHKWLIINGALGYAMAVDTGEVNDFFIRMRTFVYNNFKEVYSDRLWNWE